MFLSENMRFTSISCGLVCWEFECFGSYPLLQGGYSAYEISGHASWGTLKGFVDMESYYRKDGEKAV